MPRDERISRRKGSALLHVKVTDLKDGERVLLGEIEIEEVINKIKN